jgi:hypothetical protein
MFRNVLRDKFIAYCFACSAAFIVGGGAWAFGALRAISQPLILHFNNYIGINQVGGFGDLLGVSSVAIVVLGLNFFLAANLRERDVFFARFIAATTLFFAALIFIGFAAIISVN